MTSFVIPTNLADSLQRSNTPGLRDWAARLPGLVAELAARWSLRIGDPYQPGGRASWVAPAGDDRGRALVLKVAWTHDEAMHEPDGLRAWSDAGAVLLYDHVIDGPTTALLLERCEPGTTLSASLPEPQQDEVLAKILIGLWQAPAAGPFRSLESMCDSWADEFERDLETTHGYDLDPALVRIGIELFRKLPRTAERSALLATDLHAENVLAAKRMPWLLIDPKPYLGDPTYDALQHLLNRSLRPDPLTVVHRMATLLGLDPDRLRRWFFARCVVESIENPHLRRVAEAIRPH